MPLHEINSYQIFGAIISIVLAFLMKLAADFMPREGQSAERRILTFWGALSRLIMSIGVGFFTFVFLVEKPTWSDTLKLGIMGLASFLGSSIVDGLNGIKPKYFTELFQTIISAGAKKIIHITEQKDDTANQQIQGGDEVQEVEPDTTDMEQ